MTRHEDHEYYVKALGLELHHIVAEGFYVYHWPGDQNGSGYDRFVAVEVFSDGSAAVYLNSSTLGGLPAHMKQLRRMAKM
jgi:hypothetical protein